MQTGRFIAFPALSLLLAVVAGSASATCIDDLIPIDFDRRAATLTMNERSLGSARCQVPGRTNCGWAASQVSGAWERVSVVEVATEPTALRALLEREWMDRLEKTEADYLPAALRAAISNIRR